MWQFFRALTTIAMIFVLSAGPFGQFNFLQIGLPFFFGKPKEVLAQTAAGPGGVTNGLGLWFRSDVGVTGGSSVSSWADQSGNGNDVSQSDAARRPSIGSLNFNPALNFNADYLSRANLSFTLGTAAREYFAVSKSNTQTGGGAFGVTAYFGAENQANNQRNLAFGVFDPADNGVDDGQTLFTSGGGGNATEWYQDTTVSKTIPAIYNYRAADNAVLSQYVLSFNGKRLPVPLVKNNSGDLDFVPNIDASNRGLVIGAKQSTSGGVKNAFLRGLIPEIILYNRELSDTERKKVETYLAVKYGISIDQTAERSYVLSDDTVIWTATDNDYDCNIFGIAKDSGSSLDQRISKSQTSHAGVDPAVLTISTDTDFTLTNSSHADTLGDFSAVMISNDCQTIGTQTTEMDTDLFVERVTREWRLEKQGTTAPINMKFDGFDSSWVLVTAPGAYGSDFSSNVDIIGKLNDNGEIYDVDIPSAKRFTLMKLKSPGAVSKNLVLWLKADDNGGVTSDGSNVSVWTDQSGSGNDGTAVGSPVYRDMSDAWLNFNPSVAFDGNDDGFSLPDHTLSVGDENYTYYAVFKNPLNKNLNTLFFNGVDASNQWVRIHVDADGSVDDRFNNTGINNGTPGKILSDVPALTAFRYDTSANTKEIYVSGGLDNFVSANNKNTADTDHAVGYATNYQGSPNVLQDFFEGNVAEIVAYVNTAHDETTRNKVESYLALKYGITLDQSATGGGTVYTASDGTEIWSVDTADVFEHDIFGIGRDDGSTLDQKISKSVNPDALVTVAADNDFSSGNLDGSRSSLGNGNFLVIANNDGDATSWTIAGAPADKQILGRVWKVQETGAVGTVHLAVPDDSSSENSTLPADYGTVYLLRSNDPADFSTATETAMTFDSVAERWVVNVDFADGEYFTFATDGNFSVEVDAADDRAKEGSTADGATDNAAFVFTLSNALPVNLTVNYTVYGSAAAGSDYTALSGTVTIPAGDLSVTVPVDAGDYDDPAIEGDEHVTVTVTGTDNQVVGVGASDTATVLIVDDETDSSSGGTPVTVSVSASDPIAMENPADSGTFTVTLSEPVTENVTVTYTVSGGATPGADYTPLSGTVIVAGGATSAVITVDTSGFDDTLVEANETVSVTLATVDNGGVTVDTSADTADVIIVDDETDPTTGGTPLTVRIEATDDTALEGTGDTGTFTVTLDSPIAEDLFVDYTVSGSAAAGSDYTALSGTVMIPAGDTVSTIIVDTSAHDDTSVEGDETVVVALDNALNGGVTVDTTPETVTIVDNEQSVASVTRTTDAVEPNNDGMFTVNLSQAAAVDVTVNYTVSGSAAAGSDYTALSGTVTIPAGDLSADIPVVVIDDTLFEALETVEVTLSATDNAAVGVDSTPATVSIVDDEGNVNPVTVTLAATTNGDENGPVDIVYTATLSTVNNTGSSITFDTSFTGGSATAGDDYTDVSGPATIAIPDGETTGTLVVPVIDDSLWDDTETVTMTIDNSSNGRVTIAGPSATATIADNDTAPTVQSVTIFSDNPDSTLATVGNTITLEVTFSEAVQNVTATIAGVSGTATDIGGNSWRITIPALTGSEPEGTVAFRIEAQSLGGGELAPAETTTDGTSVTIDFTPPQDPQVNEPDPGDKVTVPTPTSGNCGPDAEYVEFTTDPAGGLNPDPQTLPLDADGNWNGLLTWNDSVTGNYDLLVSCVDETGNKKTKTISPITPVVDPEAKKITLDGGNIFVESDANDGTIRNAIFADIVNARFAQRGGTLTEGKDFTVANVPAGHTLTVTIGADGTRAVLNLVGAANAHENGDDINNIELVFADSAFEDESAASILNSSLVLGVDYFSANGGGTGSGALEYRGFFQEDTANTGVMRTSGLGGGMEIILGGGANFAADVVPGTDVIISNVPAGLTPQITRLGDTRLRLTLVGSAVSHTASDSISNLTIAFVDSAFDSAAADDVAQSIYPFGVVRFIDADDDDGDGAKNNEEDAAHNGGDGNGDGTQDRLQQNVASVKNPVTGGTFTVEVENDSCNIVGNVRGYNEAQLAVQDERGDYPIGLFGFRLECLRAGDDETVRIYLDRVYENSRMWTIRKFYPASGIYETLSPQPTISTATLQNGPQAGEEVTFIEFSVRDGEPTTDTDALRDRFITDPLGPALPIIRWETLQSATKEGKEVTVKAYSTLPLPQSLDIPLIFGGSADAGDYASVSSTLRIEAGETDASLTLRFTTDNRKEGEETLTITLRESTGYAIDESNVHTVTIADETEDETKLDKPGKVRVKCSEEGRVKITWRDKARGEDGYKVYRRMLSPQRSEWARVKTIDKKNVESYKDRGPFIPGATYQWRVRAYDGDERGEWSEKVECTVAGDDKTISPSSRIEDPTTTIEPTVVSEPTETGENTRDESTKESFSNNKASSTVETEPNDIDDRSEEGGQVNVSSSQCEGYSLWLWVFSAAVFLFLAWLMRVFFDDVLLRFAFLFTLAVISFILWYVFDICRSYGWWTIPLIVIGTLVAQFVPREDEENRA